MGKQKYIPIPFPHLFKLRLKKMTFNEWCLLIIPAKIKMLSWVYLAILRYQNRRKVTHYKDSQILNAGRIFKVTYCCLHMILLVERIQVTRNHPTHVYLIYHNLSAFLQHLLTDPLDSNKICHLLCSVAFQILICLT